MGKYIQESIKINSDGKTRTNSQTKSKTNYITESKIVMKKTPAKSLRGIADRLVPINSPYPVKKRKTAKEIAEENKAKTTIPHVDFDEDYVRKTQEVDLIGLQQEIDKLQEIIDNANSKKPKTNTLTKKGAASNKAFKQKKIEQEELDNYLKSFGYSSVEDIEKELTEKKNYYNNAKRIQEGIKLSSVVDSSSENYDSEFDKYSQKGEAMANEHSWGEYTKNVVAYWRNNPDKLKSWEKAKDEFNGAMGESVLNNNLFYLAAKYMTDSEFAIYNYYLAKENEGLVEKGTAEKYLKAIKEDLTDRQGVDIAAGKESAFSKYSYGYKAGVDQFTQGVINRFNTEDDYIATTGTQKASAQIRSDIRENHGIVGQIGYDLINTTSNMLPSILTSTAVGMINPVAGTITGATLMGTSASGNAYQEMLNLGYDKKQANTYSVLVGASEAALSYAFSGISKLGGAVTDDIIKTAISGIDNGIAKFAIEFGGKVASEGLEEAAQEVLSPLFENIALGYDKNSFKDINWAEVAYSGLLGMLAATGSSAVDTVNDMREFKNENTGKNKRLTKDDLDGYMSVGKTQHTRNKKTRMLESGKNPILTSAAEIKEFIINTIHGKASGEVRAYGIVGNRLAQAIKNKRSNLDLEGKYLELNADDLREAYKRHLTPKEKGDIALTDDDFVNIPEYIDNFDYVLGVDEYNGKIEIHLAKETEDGYVKILTVSSKERESLQATKIIGNSKEKFIKKYGKKIERDTGSLRGLTESTENPNPSTTAQLTAGTLSNNSVLQKAQTVNNNISDRAENNSQNSDLQSSAKESINTDTESERPVFREPTNQQIFRQPTAQENEEALFGERKTAKQRHILDVAQKLDKGLKVVFVANDSKVLNGKKGKYVPDTKTMYLAKDLKTVEAYNELFKHEFIHRLELRKAYGSFKDYLFNKSLAFEQYAKTRLRRAGVNTENLTRQEAIDELVDMYTKNFKGDTSIPKNIRDNFTQEKAEREAVADFVARTLFKGNTAELRVALTENIDTLVNMETDLDLFSEMAKNDRSLLQKIIDAIRDFINDFKGVPQFKELQEDLQYLEERLIRVYNSADNKKTANESGEVYKETKFLSDELTENYKEPINTKDVELLKSIKRKSINQFTNYDLLKAKKWAYKFYQQLGEKSPFFRAWFGDWRAHDNGVSNLIKTKGELRKSSVKNKDTEWEIIVSRQVTKETNHHSGDNEINAIKYLPYIIDITENAVLLNSEISDKENPLSAMFHSMYAYTEVMGYPALLKLQVEELINEKDGSSILRDYILQNIEEEPISLGKRFSKAHHHETDSSVISISDLFNLVKQYDKSFNPIPVNKIFLNKNGTPKKFYHGSKKGGRFSVFKGWQYFTENKKYAERYMERDNPDSLYEVYIKMQKPFDTRIAECKKIFEQMRMEYGLSELQENGLPDWTDGYDIADFIEENNLDYDGIILDEGGDIADGKPISRGLSYVVRSSNQIKSADNNVGTFDNENANIYYSSDDLDTDYLKAVENGDMETAQRLVDEAAREAGYRIKGHHGTDIRFTIFDREKTSTSNDFGKGFYFTSSQVEAQKYQNDDAFGDTYNKIDGIAYDNALERIRDMGEDASDDALFTKLYNEEFDKELKRRTDEGVVINAYLKMEKPFIVSTTNWITEEEAIDIAQNTMYVDNVPNDAAISDWVHSIKSYAKQHDGKVDTYQFANNMGHSVNLTSALLTQGIYDGILDYSIGTKFNSTADYHAIALYPNKIKDSAPITYDNNGNVIPLSERFNATNEDIRYSSDDIPNQTSDLLDRHEKGEITREQLIEELDTLYGKANEKYGIIKEGEKSQTPTPVAVPKAVAEDKPTEQFTRTILETGKLTKDMVESMETEILLGNFSYKVSSDEKAMREAETAIKNGVAEEMWNETVNTSARISKNQVAIGEQLLANAIAANDTFKVLNLSAELADVFTRAGQVVQSARLLKKMTGIGKLVSLQKTIKTINKDLVNKYGENAPEIKISEELAKLLVNAKSKEAIEQAYQEIMQEVANKTPVTFLDKWNAWRYFAMLANPRTHIRNLFGNGIFAPAVRIKDFIAAGIEKKFIEESKRTKSVKIKKEYKDFAKKDGQRNEVKQLLKGGKYNDKTALKEKQQIFQTKALEFITRFNSNALEAEDMLFKNKHYIHALAGYLQARNIDLETVSQGILDEARIYAVEEAKKATFNDESALANAVQRFGNKNLVANLLVEGVLPFKRTPINIVKRGIEYSPIGLGKTLTKGIFDIKKGKITVTEFIDGLASGLTGTGIMLVGMFLANLGCISGGEDDDEKSQFEKLLGKQEYAVEILGSSYTIDWAAPACIPFFIGVEIVNTINEGEAFELSQIGNAVWNSLEPITNLSMLSGIQGVIESARYADSAQTLSAIAVDSLTSYAMQGIPSLSGAVARTIDPTQRSWYIDKNDKWLDSTAQTVKNNIQSKVPGLSYTQTPKIDAWGRKVSRGNLGERIIENFISPGYYSEIEYDEVNEELKRLFVKTGENVLPKDAAKSFSVNGEKKQLTADEYVRYAMAKGEYSFDYMNEFINSSAYEKLSDDERAEVVVNLYEYANAKAKCDVSDYDLVVKGSKYKTVTNWERNGGSAVIYYISRAKDK